MQSDAKRLALAAKDRLPADLVSQLLSANNQMLKAAIIQNGGGLEISTQAIYETLTHKGHVIATENEDGSIRLSWPGSRRSSKRDQSFSLSEGGKQQQRRETLNTRVEACSRRS